MHGDLKRKYGTKIKKVDDSDKWRKRVLAAIQSYFERQKMPHSSEYVLAVLRQSSGYYSINNIPEAKLIALYNFCNNKNDIADRSNLLTMNVN